MLKAYFVSIIEDAEKVNMLREHAACLLEIVARASLRRHVNRKSSKRRGDTMDVTVMAVLGPYQTYF